jgi:hypothetical protein
MKESMSVKERLGLDVLSESADRIILKAQENFALKKNRMTTLRGEATRLCRHMGQVKMVGHLLDKAGAV